MAQRNDRKKLVSRGQGVMEYIKNIENLKKIYIAVEALEKENEKYKKEIAQNLSGIKKYKAAVLRNERSKAADQEIWHTYFKNGGVRFYGMELLDYARDLLQQPASLEEMRIIGYNSNIAHMRSEFERLEQKLQELQDTSKDGWLEDERELRVSVGYEECEEKFAYFHSKESKKDSSEYREYQCSCLKKLVEGNGRAAENARKCSEEADGVKERSWENRNLYEVMKELLSEEQTQKFSLSTPFTEEDYRRELLEYTGKLGDKLLNQYTLD